jgi:hypothetical protein
MRTWARMRSVDKDEDVGKDVQRGRGWGGGRQQGCVVWAETCDKDRNVGRSALMIWANSEDARKDTSKGVVKCRMWEGEEG